jgi:hydrogenase nickel incorporation protein HypB
MCTRGEIHGPVSGADRESAARIRRELERRRTLMINLISSPGSGKTALLEATISRLKTRVRLAALEGDVAADLDAARLCRQGIPARQILTAGACHLDARQIEHEIGHLGREPLDIIFVENVGNLICPAHYDLGEDFKLALLSVAEGDDAPFKYPATFSKASLVVVTKADLLPHVDFDIERVRRKLRAVQPDAGLAITSTRSGEGLDAWCRWLGQRLETKRAAAAHLAPTA